MKTADDGERKRTRAPETALRAAVKLLSTRPYSEKKLREKLISKYPREEIDQAIRRLREEKFVDDARYAEDFVRARIASRPRSGFVLTRELAQRGIARAVAQDVVNRLVPDESNEQLARELLTRKQTQYQGLDEPTRRRRLTAFLARRGFSYSVIQKVLQTPPDAESEY